MSEPTFTQDADVLPVKISTEGPGRARIEVAGREIARHLFAFHVDMSATEAFPVVTLEAKKNTTVEFEGLAHVQVAHVETDPGPAAAAFLAAIDPGELEKAALNRPDLDPGPGGLTKAMLTQLVEWANGRS